MGFSWSHGIGKSHVEREDVPHRRAAVPPAVWCFPSLCRALPASPAAGWELGGDDMAVPGGVAGGCVVGKGGWSGGASALLGGDAAQEHGYYLQQLFGQYGANGTLPFEGLARLLGSLGLGRVQDAGLGALQHRPPPRRCEQGWGGVTRWDPPGSPSCSSSPSGTQEPQLHHCCSLLPPPPPPPPRQCLNVTQLLVNFGLDSVSQLTPEQFTLLCPALLYQIDSRVCIQHTPSPGPPSAALGWGLLAVTFISLPSALAVLLIPLLSHSFFHSLLAFLVALAVGTLCGDALLHLWPHAQGKHQETPAEPGAAVLQGLAVLGGIYLLFLVELLLGMLQRNPLEHRSACGPRPRHPPRISSAAGAELRHLTAPEPELELKPHGYPHGHSHGHSHGPTPPPSPRATDVVWMVVLGDGIHNLTDGLAIGAAFSHSLSSGLSTALAVLCHELPHELGDLAVLLQAGTAPRTILLLNLLSALLSCLGAVAGAAVGQSASHLTPWILTATAGIFLYVALADMLPEALRGAEGPGEGTWGRLLLQNVGFLLGSGIMLGIALAEGHVRAWLQP
uniref:Solute carrier family 39 member 5 n=1 Tax=Aquila chrysaetos chrysaetos TaxID=223781 RepID=A0A663FBC0_AQUCH